MHKLIKNEEGHRYGDFEVIKYTNEREPLNGTVKWLCRCVHCGQTFLRNRNHLRFNKTITCPNCRNMRRKRR